MTAAPTTSSPQHASANLESISQAIAAAKANPHGSPGVFPATRPLQPQAVLERGLTRTEGAWVMQYAQRLANEHGPFGVLHLIEDWVRVSVVHPFVQVDRPIRTQPAPLGDEPGLRSLMRMLGQTTDQLVSGWLVRLTGLDDNEKAMRAASLLQQWTLILPSENAAVVDGYCLLKQMVHQSHRQGLEHVGAVVVGAEQEAAEATARRLNAITDSLLRKPIRLLGWQQQMQPVCVEERGAWPFAATHWPPIASYIQATCVSHRDRLAPVARIGPKHTVTTQQRQNDLAELIAKANRHASGSNSLAAPRDLSSGGTPSALFNATPAPA